MLHERDPVKRQTSGIAIASLVLSILSILVGPLGFVPGIVLGHIAKSELKKHPELGGHGYAKAGLIVGYGFLVMGVLLLLFMLIGGSADPRR